MAAFVREGEGTRAFALDQCRICPPQTLSGSLNARSSRKLLSSWNLTLCFGCTIQP